MNFGRLYVRTGQTDTRFGAALVHWNTNRLSLTHNHHNERVMHTSWASWKRARLRMARLRSIGYAVEARYESTSRKVEVRLSDGQQLSFSVSIDAALRSASDEHLSKIDISPSGLGLHWPALDVDLYLPPLLSYRKD